MALAIALFTLATLMLAATGGMLVTSSTVRATRNYRGSSQVRFVAESAISQALQIINGPGIVSFEANVQQPWAGTYGTAYRSFAPFAGFDYYVTPIATPGNVDNAGRLVATARGSDGVQNTVVAQVIRANIPSTAPGAIYLAADTATNS
jgi:hypothetical protein